MNYTNYIDCVIIVVIIYLIIIFNANVNTNANTNTDFVINTIIRGCARWATASLQDKSPIVAVLHANYAAGYLWALRDVFSDTEIRKSSGIDIIKFQKKITDVQDHVTQLLIKVCPQYVSDIDVYLGKIGGEHLITESIKN